MAKFLRSQVHQISIGPKAPVMFNELLDLPFDLLILFVIRLQHKGGHLRIETHNLHLGFHPLKHSVEEVFLLITAAFGQIFHRGPGPSVQQEEIKLLFIAKIVF